MSEISKFFDLYGLDPERFEDVTFLIHLHERVPYLLLNNREIWIRNKAIEPRKEEIEILGKLGIVAIERTSPRLHNGERYSVYFASIAESTLNRPDFQDLVSERYYALAEVSTQIDDAFKFPLIQLAKQHFSKTDIYGSPKMPILSSMVDFPKLVFETPLVSFYIYYLQLYNYASWRNLEEALLQEGWLLITNYIFTSKSIYREDPYYRISPRIEIVWNEGTVNDERFLEQIYNEPDCLAIFCLGKLALHSTFDCQKFIQKFGLDPESILERMFEINEEIRTELPSSVATRLVRIVAPGQPMLAVGDQQQYLSALTNHLPDFSVRQ